MKQEKKSVKVNSKDMYRERIEYTGRYSYESVEEALFSHLVITEKELEKIGLDNIRSFAKKQDVDFVSVQKNSKVEFVHYTDIDNEESIDKLGLLVMDNEFIMDLGDGIYAIKCSDGIGYENLSNYFDGEEKDGSDKTLKVTGIYTGEYLECIHGEGHMGYLVLGNNVPAKNLDSEVVTFNEEFGFCIFS